MPGNEKEQIIDFRQVGATGLRRFSGFIYEDFLHELIGWKAVAIYKEMGDNDSTVGAVRHAIDTLCRRVPWHVQKASEEQYDKEAAEFLEQCMNDMDNTWIDTISEILSFLQYGHSVHEIVYKRRCGDGFDPSQRSKYTDGRIGWRGLPIRSQDTLYRWQFDDHGGIQGVEQLSPPHYYHVTIPIEKMLLFRTTTHKNNPEGRSMFRSAYRSWYMKKNIENIEAIGIERDLAGLPFMTAPAELFSKNASAEQKALLGELKNIVTNVRRDEQEGIILPMQNDPVSGKPLYDFKLLSTGGSRQMDVDKVINRYDQRIAMCALADFMLLGQQNVGSWAMHSDKTKLFSMSMGAFLDIIAEILNNFAIPRLFALNDFQVSDYPKLMHGDVQSVDLKELGDYITKLAGAGMPLFPDEGLEEYLRKAGNLPEMVKPAVDIDQQVQPTNRVTPDKITEIANNPIQMPNGLNQTADTTPVNGKPNPQVVTTNQLGNTESLSAKNMGRSQSPEQYTDWRKW